LILSKDFFQSGILEVQTIEQERKHIRSAYFPEISVGYFNQSLDNVRNFQGVQVSLSAPLFNRQQRLDLKKSTLEITYQETVNASLTSHWQSTFHHTLENFTEVRTFYNENAPEYRREIDFLSTASANRGRYRQYRLQHLPPVAITNIGWRITSTRTKTSLHRGAN